MIKKITTGFVIQDFDDNGNCIGQEFIAGEVDWENDKEEKIEVEKPENFYHTFDMVQPITDTMECQNCNLVIDDRQFEQNCGLCDSCVNMIQ